MGNGRRQGRRVGKGSVRPLRPNATPAESIAHLEAQRSRLIAGVAESVRYVREIELLQAQWRARAAGESEDINQPPSSPELMDAIRPALDAEPAT